MSTALTGLLTIFAAVILLWGFERYRTRFVRTDLLISIAVAMGLLSVAYVPMVFEWIGQVFSIRRRIFTMVLLANLGLLLLVLYLGTVVRKTRGDIKELTRQLSVKNAPQSDGGRREINIVIPAYNEVETIGGVLSSLPNEIRGYPIKPIVISDGSGDETAHQAETNGCLVVEHALNQGQGGALQTGFNIAMQNEAAIVVTMDADGQHPVRELEQLVNPIIDNEADFVIGSRHLGSDDSGNSHVRRAGIRTFTHIINILAKLDITDCTSGYRAFRGDELAELHLREERFNAPELIIEARKNGLRIKEIPITIKEREVGETKKPQLNYAIGLARTILFTWIR